MKEKIYFITSSIIGIISLLYNNIINLDELIKEEIANVDNILNNDTLNMLSNPHYYYFLAIIGISLFLSIIIIFLTKKETKYRTFLLTSSIILIFTSSSTVLLLIPLINLFFISNIPKPEKIKKEMPILDKKIVTKKIIIKSILLIIIYLFINFFLMDLILFFIKNPSAHFNMFLNIITDIFLFVLTISLFYQELIYSFKLLIQNFSSYSKYIFKNFGFLLLANIGCSLIIMLFTHEISTSQNQIALNNLPFWYLLPAASIYAPLVEEVVFRGCFRNLIKNDKLFLIISALSFGFLHTIGQEATIINTLLYALPYIAMGFVLAYTYKKSGNIATNTTLHALNNFLSSMLSFL